jgi:hypothetical protein
MASVRHARYSELPLIAQLYTETFWNDNLIGDLIHPHRKQYPQDMHLFWLRQARVNFWDPRYRWIVAVHGANGTEQIAGAALWERLSEGSKELEYRWFDPRKCARPSWSVRSSLIRSFNH